MARDKGLLMRVVCRSGHYSFYPRSKEEISRFCSIYNVKLFRVNDFYTFEALKELPDFSISGVRYGNLIANKNIEGNQWEVMKANGFVYSIQLGLLVPKDSIGIMINIAQNGFFYSPNSPFIQAGSINQSKKIMSFDGEFDFGFNKLLISEFSDE